MLAVHDQNDMSFAIALLIVSVGLSIDRIYT